MEQDAHHRGLELVQKGQLQEALKAFYDALREEPLNPLIHNHLGNVYKRLGDFEKAQMHYEEAFRIAPQYPSILSNIGAFFYSKGEYERAKYFLQEASRIDPSHLVAFLCLGHASSQLGQFEQAQHAYEQVLALNPRHSDANHNLAMLYIQDGRFQEALPLLQYSSSIDPNPEGLYHLGIIYGTIGAFSLAKEAYERTLALEPTHDKAAHNLAQILLQLGDQESAASYFRLALTLNPDNGTAQHMLSALTQKEVPSQAKSGFVKSLFDQYADTYDNHLSQQLQYQVPALLRSIISPYAKHTPWEVMDLGCGTGLCAPYFNDIALKLYGIDLSSAMLAKAKQLGAYYRLLQGDIVEQLELFYEVFDLMIAADVLVYFGDLLPLFTRMNNSLKAGGFFTASCEPYEGTAYCLQSSGRYAHSRDYIRQCVEAVGWILREIKVEVLRTQEGQPVQGFIFVAQKPT